MIKHVDTRFGTSTVEQLEQLGRFIALDTGENRVPVVPRKRLRRWLKLLRKHMPGARGLM